MTNDDDLKRILRPVVEGLAARLSRGAQPSAAETDAIYRPAVVELLRAGYGPDEVRDTLQRVRRGVERQVAARREAAADGLSAEDVRLFSADAPARQRSRNFADGAQLTPADAKRYSDYFAADGSGHYPGDMHLHFNLNVKQFADATGMKVFRVPLPSGESAWRWLPRLESRGDELRRRIVQEAVHLLKPPSGATAGEAEYREAAQRLRSSIGGDPELRRLLADGEWVRAAAAERAEYLAKSLGCAPRQAADALAAGIQYLCRRLG